MDARRGAGSISTEPSMQKETIPELDLARLPPEAWRPELERLGNAPLVTLRVPLNEWRSLKGFLPELRASNKAFIVLLKRHETPLPDADIPELFACLRDWDQFLIVNFLEICGAEWIAEPHAKALKVEAVFELTWFRQWSTALSDPRLHLYPGLPWRSFIRRISGENYRFALALLSPENEGRTDELFAAFLMAKKKVVNLFPKKWKERGA